MRAVPFVRGLLLALVVLLLSGCGYNQIQGKDEAVKAGWSEVLNQYKRRADLIPNLVATVKGYAGHDQQFLALQTQLEGTENRITVARGRYIQLVQDYNTYIRKFPVNLTAMLFGYKAKPNFTVENEVQIQQAPSVDFAPPPVAPAAAPPVAPAPGGVVNPPQPNGPPVQGGNAPQAAETQ